MANRKKIEKKSKKPQSKFIGTVKGILDGSFLTRETLISQLPYMFFLMFLSLIYIGNTYYAEKTFKQTQKLERKIKELNSEHISIASSLMKQSKQTEIAKKVESLGLKESVVPPRKIIVNKGQIKE